MSSYKVVFGIQETLRTSCDSLFYDVSELEITEGPRDFVEKI